LVVDVCSQAARQQIKRMSEQPKIPQETERYTDGIELDSGLVQGIRFDISAGKPSFRIGARLDDAADVTVLLTAAAARKLNLLYSSDPA